MSGKRRKEVPVVFDQPACAYVKRLEPKSWQGKKLPERLPRIDGIHNICEDLEGEVARRNGGGHYRARTYDQATKKLFHGVHEFRIAFEPKIDGEPALPRTPKARLAEPVATRTQVEPRLIEDLTEVPSGTAEAQAEVTRAIARCLLADSLRTSLANTADEAERALIRRLIARIRPPSPETTEAAGNREKSA